MSIDTIGDFLTCIRNALLVSKRSVTVPFSNKRLGIAKILQEEGFIKDYTKKVVDDRDCLTIQLKYVGGESVIHEIKRVSTPGRRRYEKSKAIESVIGGMGISILTTNAGIITDKQARKLHVGGEVICHVW